MKISAVSKNMTSLVSCKGACNAALEIENDSDNVMISYGDQLAIIRINGGKITTNTIKDSAESVEYPEYLHVKR
jgi:hypothetical protein